MSNARPQIHLLLWLLSVAAVVGVGLVYMPREPSHPGFFEALYATLRLFVFERDLPQFPHAWPLAVIYFAAPLITISVLGTAVTYFFKISPFFKTRRISDHVVVCGVGRTGKLIASSLKKNHVKVVGIDLGPAEELDEWSYRAAIPMLCGDFHRRKLLQRAGAHRARSVVFASGDDLENLEGALNAYQCLKGRARSVTLIWAHIANEALAQTARDAVRTVGLVGIRYFDIYRIAASKVVAEYFHRQTRRGVSEVVLLGFGKFGRDLLEMLLRDFGSEESFEITVIDQHDQGRAVRDLIESLGFSGGVRFVRKKIQELDLDVRDSRAYLLCTDDDLGNLSLAMALSEKAASSPIYVRMAHWPLPAMAEHLGRDRGVVFINVNDLVVQSLPTLSGLFQPASPADLKRVARPGEESSAENAPIYFEGKKGH